LGALLEKFGEALFVLGVEFRGSSGVGACAFQAVEAFGFDGVRPAVGGGAGGAVVFGDVGLAFAVQ
jgi:hypothetical protein